MTLPGGHMTQAPYDPIKGCRACGCRDIPTIANLGNLHISCFPAHFGESMGRAPLELVRCVACTLVQLKHTVSRDWLYREYWYRSGTNSAMADNLNEIVALACSWVDLDVSMGRVVLDIGANDGTLLDMYLSGTTKAAFEPAENLAGELHKGMHIDYIASDYFPPVTQAGADIYDIIKGRVAIVTSIAMFYDLSDPNVFVQSISEVLAPEGVWVMELSYLPLMLQNTAFDSICHEHLEYYTMKSIQFMLRRHGLKIVDVYLSEVNGGSIRLVIAKEEGPHELKGAAVHTLAELALAEGSLLKDSQGYDHKLFEDFMFRCQYRSDVVRELVQAELDAGGVVDVYGASTKGNTLLQYFGIDHTYIRWAIERAPEKWGRYTVGTNIPIVSEEQARNTDQAATLWLVPIWHFRNAVIAREQEFLNAGGKMLFPLPFVEVISGKA